jgi:uncharacterized iron-regulated membrane protein
MSARRLLILLHRWTGLTAASFVLLAGLSGSVIAFDDELDAWLNADVWHVAPQERPRPLTELIATVEAHYPEARVWYLPLERHRDESQRMRLTPRGDGSEDLRTDEVWIDPYRGTILGERLRGSLQLDRRHLIPFLYDFHYSLSLGEPGVMLMGGIGLAWLIGTLVGLYVGWPRRGQWAQSLSIRLNAGTLPALYDLHRSCGIIFAAVLALLAFSGACMNLTGISFPLVRLFSDVREMPVDTMPSRPALLSSYDPQQMLTRAVMAAPRAIPTGMLWNHAKGIVTVELAPTGESQPASETLLYFDMADGSLLDRVEPHSYTSGERFLLWQLPLHGGEVLGLAGRSVIAWVGLIVPLLAVTGVIIWYRKRARRGSQRNR